MIDMRKLRLLVELERLGTLSAVAHELHLTGPGVSLQLSALERELRIELTERRGRRLALTPAGRRLAEHGREILDRLSLAESEATDLRHGTAGGYSLVSFPSAARTFVADTWGEALRVGDGPDLALATDEPEEAIASLLTGEADLAVIHSYSNVPRTAPSNLVTTHLVEEPIWLAIPTDAPEHAPVVDLADLADHRWIAPPPTRTCYHMVERACGLSGFRPRVVASSCDFAAQLQLVGAGVGVALVPHLTVGHVPEGVAIVRPGTPLHRTVQIAVRSPRRADPGIVRLTEALRRNAELRVGPYSAPPIASREASLP